jgi:predicted RNase H-like nuclease (RuvC/YqgF family)
MILKQKAFSSILEKFEKSFEELKKQLDNFRSTNEMNELIVKNYNIDNRNYTKLNNYKEIYEKNFNLQKINKMVKDLNNMLKNNNNYQEININNDSSKIKKEIKIEEQTQEFKECNSLIPFNKSQILSINHNSFNKQGFYEKKRIIMR